MHNDALSLLALAAAATLATAFSASAATTPVFTYSFPASWPGTGTTVTDQSAAGNNGVTNSSPALSATVPPGAAGGTQSVTTNGGGIVTSAKKLLSNDNIAAAGGFRYDVDFLWDGTDSTSFGHVEKILDYAGTDGLQITSTAGSADLELRFNDTTNVLNTTIQPNVWYQVQAEFDTAGSTVAGDGSLAGFASMSVTDLTNAGSPTLFGPTAVTKTNAGDAMNRPIGVGELGSTFGYLVGFKGDIYNPSVSLVPEPASMSLLFLAAPMLLKRRTRRAD